MCVAATAAFAATADVVVDDVVIVIVVVIVVFTVDVSLPLVFPPHHDPSHERARAPH